MLSGIVHFNKNHVGFSEQEIKTITREVLENFYSQEMKDEDIRRAYDAAVLWASWVQVSIKKIVLRYCIFYIGGRILML